MPKFLIMSKDQSGTQNTDVIDAVDLDKAVSSVQNRGRFVVSVQPFN